MKYIYKVFDKRFTRKNDALKYARKVYGGDYYFTNVYVYCYDSNGLLFIFLLSSRNMSVREQSLSILRKEKYGY